MDATPDFIASVLIHNSSEILLGSSKLRGVFYRAGNRQRQINEERNNLGGRRCHAANEISLKFLNSPRRINARLVSYESLVMS